MLKYNIRGKIFSIVESMYKHSQIQIKMNDKITKSIRVNTGVKQGEVLSPTLFNLFINDLPENIPIDNDTPLLENKDIRCLLYADDLVLFSLSPVGLQNSINGLNKFCSTWNLEVNIKKTKILKFSGNGHKCSEKFNLNNYLLENVQKYKYLGIEFSASCAF
jgi:hypothetical protein